MNFDHSSCGSRLPAPCLVDTGVLVNKRDMQRLLMDLNRVRYIYSQDAYSQDAYSQDTYSQDTYSQDTGGPGTDGPNTYSQDPCHQSNDSPASSRTTSEGEGCILEVFCDPQRSTMIANHSLYLNVLSFDYLEMGRSPEQETWFDLFQDGRRLRLIPLTHPLNEQYDRRLNHAALEAMVAEVLSANWDVQIDDEEHFSF